jgi:hypothetical protein
MFENFRKNEITRAVFALGVLACCGAAHGQALVTASSPGAAVVTAAQNARQDLRQVALAVTFEDAGANLTYASALSFNAPGGGAELALRFRNGFSAIASVHAFHASQSGNSVPVNVLVSAAGPRYTLRPLGARHRVEIFAQGLIGRAYGFDGLYPSPTGTTSSAGSLAYELGGGLDLHCTRRLSVRALQVDWIRSELPNATNNIQNTLRLGVGVVFHTGPPKPPSQ